MTLGRLLTVDHIIPNLDAAEQWPAIDEMAGLLFTRDLLPASDRPAVLEGLRQREQQFTTNIGSGVAIPHAFHPELREVLAVFARSRTGISFGDAARSPVHLIVLFILPQHDHRLRLETLAAIAKTVAHGEMRQRLLEAGSAEEILALLSGRDALRV